MSTLLSHQHDIRTSWNYQILKQRFHILRDKLPTDSSRGEFILAFGYELKLLKDGLKDELRNDKSLDDLHTLIININKIFDSKIIQEFDYNFKASDINVKMFNGIYKIVENCLLTLTKFL
jgi:hypothetical protein